MVPSSLQQCLVIHKYSVCCELSHFILKPHGYAFVWDGNTLQEAGEVGDLLWYPQAISLHGKIR